MGAFSLLVSIIIPTFNRSDMLEFTLPRIVELTHTVVIIQKQSPIDMLRKYIMNLLQNKAKTML